MNEVWNLNPIYNGFDDPQYARDIHTLRQTVQELDTFCQHLDEKDPLEGLRTGLLMQEKMLWLAQKLIGYASFRQAANTLDEQANSNLGLVLGIYSNSAAPCAAFDGWAAKLPNLSQLIASDELLSEYRFMLENVAQSSAHLLPGIGEAVAAKLHLSGSNAWAEMHQFLTSTVPVSYRGENTTLTAVRALAYSEDAAVRKDAYEAELACYEAIKEPAAFALNSIKLETLTEGRLRHYASPLDWTLADSHLQKRTLDAMFAAIDEYLPKFWQYLAAKGKALGHENGLPWYDMFAPMGKSSGGLTTEFTRDYLVETFSHFDSELSAMVAEAFDNAWIDFYPRPGKTGGAFCEGIPSMEESRIMTNFTGTFSDVVVLAHELGHAFHNYCLKGHRPLNRNYSMPVAETASTFNECVVMNKAIKDAADDAEKLALLESQLRDVTQIICDIYSRYLFEAAVFANREKHFMNADALCAMMNEAQKKTYGTGLDQSTLHPYMWVCKSHYYGAIYYNFPYAFGGLFARGLYARYEQEGESFLPKYKQLLHTTSVATAEETAKVAGIDLTDKAFWQSALQIVAKKIDMFCELVQKV